MVILSREPPRDTDAEATETGVAEGTGETAAAPIRRRKRTSPRVALRAGTHVGRYEIVETLGAGGMGVVYRARDDELDRNVALKLVVAENAEGASRGQARLLREAQAQAQLAHPNVAAIYDVGRYEGAVFLAMELVEGERLDVWAKRAPRSWKEVRRVMQDAGRGLHAAHVAGLVHRDFKPANVMIGRDGRVRVLDFGLARAAGDATPPSDEPPPTVPDHELDLDLHTSSSRLGDSITQVGAIIGTPAYMAPEQHKGAIGDARSDQFSFCVTMYQALYGELPFAGANRAEMRDAMRQGDVRPPPADRKVPAWIRRIVVRGLAPDPAARWPSMIALLDALDRDPAQRWRRIGAAAGVAALATAAAIGLFARGDRAPPPCQGAAAELDGIWDAARRDAVHARFVASGTPYAADADRAVERGLDGYARGWIAMRTEACKATEVEHTQSAELLDLRMECLAQRKDELRAQIDILSGADTTVVEHAAQAVQALPPLAQCGDVEALRQRVRPPTDPKMRAKVDALRKQSATVKALLASGRYADGLVAARALATEARAVAYRPFQAEALFELGRLQEVTGDYAAAADSLRDAGIDAEAGRDDRIAARAWIQLVWVIGARLGKADEAQTLAREAEAKLERAGADDLMLAELDRVRGQLASDAGKAAVALDYAQRVLALRRKASPDDVAAIALAESDVADALAQQGTYDQAIAQYRDALADMERAVGADHPMRISTLTNLATALRAQAHYDEALAVFDRAEAIAIEVYGPDHPTLATIYMDRGGVERAQGKLDAASAHYDRALAIWTRALGPDHANVGTVHYYRGSVALEQGRIDLAIGEFERARDIWQRALGPDNPSLSAAYAGLGDARLAKGDARGALAAYERGIALIEKALGPTHPDLANGLTGAGLARLALGDPRRAVASLERALAIRVADPGDPVDLARTQFGLARALVAAGGDRARARDLAEHARAAFAASPTGQREAAAVEAWRARL